MEEANDKPSRGKRRATAPSVSDRAGGGAGLDGAPLVFFDLDGTLVVGQSTLLLVQFLRRAGIVSRTFLLGAGLWFLGYKLGLLKVTERTRNHGARVFAGRGETEVDDLMERFTDEVLAPRFHAAATAALSEHMAEGHRVVLISAALEPVVKAVCSRLGVTDYVGTACEVEAGYYSGRLLGPSPHADEKRRLAARYIKDWGVDSGACWAYADHGSDLGLLQSVGHPVAVNPKPELLEVAQRSGWPILA